MVQLTITSATMHSTPTPGRAITANQNFVAPIHLQPVRLQRRRTVLHPRQVQHQPQKVFWYWGQEWVRQRTTDLRDAGSADGEDAAGRFQRTAGSGQRVLRQGHGAQGPDDGNTVCGQHHSGEPAEPEWHGHSQGVSAAELNGFLNGNQNWFCGRASDTSAQRHLVGGLQSDGQSAHPVPPHELCISGNISR